MKLSIVSEENQGKIEETVEIKKLADLCELITVRRYSLGVFSDNVRRKDTFIEAESIGLDFDEGYSLEQAKTDFAEYMHVIAPTRSHRKEKNGKVEDRFRVILFLESPITDCQTFETTWLSLFERWPQADRACKDASRFFYPSTSVESVVRKGKKIAPVAPAPKAKVEAVLPSVPGEKGRLARETRELLEKGAEPGGRNHTVYKAAKDFQQALFTEDEAISQIVPALEANGTIHYDFPEAEVVAAIRSAYSTPPKHEPRIKKRAFRLQTISELYKETEDVQIEWLVEGLLPMGGISLLSADPKAGKSTIARQLCLHVLTNQAFFGRKVKQGAVHYYGLEEHRNMLALSFRRLGIPQEAPLLVHAEDPLSDEDMFRDFSEIINETKPALAVVDTAFDLLEVESENNYREVKKAFKKVRKVARESGTHILLIHHNGKPQKDFKRRGNHAILGSTAISGGVDAIMVVELEGRTRLLSTSGREVEPITRRTLIWDKESATYKLGPEYEEDEF